MSPKSNIWFIILLFSPLVVVVLSSLDTVFAQEGEEYVIRRVEIWSLFYRLMVAAGAAGAAGACAGAAGAFSAASAV